MGFPGVILDLSRREGGEVRSGIGMLGKGHLSDWRLGQLVAGLLENSV